MAAITEADGVFQGGGVKGLALVGALLGFAEHGEVAIQRWVNVAGTSAGAIIAAYLATGHGPQDLETLLRRTPYEKFEDWGPGGEIAGGAWNLAKHHGLAHGEYFRKWFDDQLQGAKFASVKREDDTPDKAADPYRLRLIASDVTQGRMLVLPADLANYKLPGTDQPIAPDEFKIADAVRMSMSIPFFFQPVLLESVDTGVMCTIVDGGLLSNFPVWLFDIDAQVTRPTFGFHLTGGKGIGGGLARVVKALGWPVQLGTEMFHTATEAWDARFMSNSTVVRTCPVPAGNVGTTDFTLSEADQQQLIEGGKQAANSFLDDFHIEDYVNTFGRTLAH
jgi:NTE family protein